MYAESYSAFYIHFLLVKFRLIFHVFILVFTTKNSELFIVVLHVKKYQLNESRGISAERKPRSTCASTRQAPTRAV